MAIQGDEPTSSANIKALTDNLKTWVTNQIDAAKTWTSSQITTAINNLKKTTPQEKQLFYSADGASEGTYNASGCRIARISYANKISNKTYHYYVVEVPFTSGDVKIDATGITTTHITFNRAGFKSSGVNVIRVVGII